MKAAPVYRPERAKAGPGPPWANDPIWYPREQRAAYPGGEAIALLSRPTAGQRGVSGGPGPTVGARTSLGVLLTLWAALCGVVAVSAIALFAASSLAAMGRLGLVLAMATLGCASLALGAHLFIRRWSVGRRDGVDFTKARAVATGAFALTPILLLIAHGVPGAPEVLSYWSVVGACLSYGVGAMVMVAHGTRTDTSRSVRILFWCAMPLFVAFVGLIAGVVVGGLRLY